MGIDASSGGSPRFSAGGSHTHRPTPVPPVREIRRSPAVPIFALTSASLPRLGADGRGNRAAGRP